MATEFNKDNFPHLTSDGAILLADGVSADGTKATGYVAVGQDIATTSSVLDLKELVINQNTEVNSLLETKVDAGDLASGITVKSSALSFTQSAMVLQPGIPSQLSASNPNRRYLFVVNVGTGTAWLGFGGLDAMVAAGVPLTASYALGEQGGSMCFEASSVPIDRISAISTAGTTLVVLEG